MAEKPPVVFFKEAPTRSQGVKFTLGGGKEKTFGGAPAPRHRKQIVISNNDNQSILYVVSETSDDPASPGNRMVVIPIHIRQSITLFTSSPVTVRNLHATNPIEAFVWESFYD